MKALNLLIVLGSALLIQAADIRNAERLIDGGHWKAARAVLEERVSINPKDARADYLLAEVRLAFGARAEALKLVEKAIDLDRRNADYHFLRARILGETAENSGFFNQFLYGSHFKEEAETVLTLNPNHTDVRYALMLFYLKAPSALGGKKKAEALTAEIEHIDPFEGYMARARLAEEQHDSGAIERYYLKAIARAPQEYESEVALAEFYASDGQRKYELAETHAQTALKLDSGRSTAYVVLSNVLTRQHRFAELDSLLLHSERNVPDDFAPYYEAARVLLLDAQELDRAEKYLRKYLSQEPEGEAPGLGSAHWQLAKVFEQRGMKNQAVIELKEATRLQPELDGAKKDLQRLR